MTTEAERLEQERQQQAQKQQQAQQAAAKAYGPDAPEYVAPPPPKPPPPKYGPDAPEYVSPPPKPPAPVFEPELGEGPPPPVIQPPVLPDRPGGQVATVSGEQKYIKGSTMYEMGFRTPKEYLLAQQAGVSYGVHEGKLVPKDSVLVTVRGIEKNKDSVVRYSGEKEGVSQAVYHGLEKGKYRATREQAAAFERWAKESGIYEKLEQSGALKNIEILEKNFKESHVIIKGGEAIPIDQWLKLDKKYQRIALKDGYDAMIRGTGERPAGELYSTA